MLSGCEAATSYGMTMLKNKVFLTIITAGAVFSVIYLGGFWPSDQQVWPTESPALSPEPTGSISSEPTATPRPIPNLTKSPVPLPTGDDRTTFIDKPVPWELLLKDASCKLQGEIKFLASDLYNNQDAGFIYSGADSPARNIFWTVTPDDNLSVGPNLFSKMSLPNGDSLLSIVLPENPKSKTYTLTAKIQYGRLVDEKGKYVAAGGNVKVFEKQCEGQTTVVLP